MALVGAPSAVPSWPSSTWRRSGTAHRGAPRPVVTVAGTASLLAPKIAARCRGARATCRSGTGTAPGTAPTETAEAETATWHRGCSSSADLDEAIAEVVHEWQQSMGRPRFVEADEVEVASTWAPFSRIDELWHNWRAGAFGPITLGQVIKSSADQKDLREAFKLFPDQGRTE